MVSLMVPNPKKARHLTSARDCPVCGEAVHWTRYWLRSWAWAKWPCSRCGSLLGFDTKRRWVIVIALMPLLLYFGAGRYSRYSLVTGLLVGLAVAAASTWLERVVVIGDRNPRYCPTCRYDLSGTLAAGIATCPECGGPALDQS
jgi:hypothetical protein